MYMMVYFVKSAAEWLILNCLFLLAFYLMQFCMHYSCILNKLGLVWFSLKTIVLLFNEIKYFFVHIGLSLGVDGVRFGRLNHHLHVAY